MKFKFKIYQLTKTKQGINMRSSRITTIIILLSIFLFLNNNIAMGHASTNAENSGYSGLRINRLILNETNLTFTFNDTFRVFLLMQNNGQYFIYNLNFNYTVDTTTFKIVSSSNTTSRASSFVYNNINKIEPGQVDTFNITLRVVSNTTNTGVIIPSMILNYQFGQGTDRIPGVTNTNQLSINIQAPNTGEILQSKVNGNIELNSQVLILILASPIVLAFILSFIFGRRKNKS